MSLLDLLFYGEVPKREYPESSVSVGGCCSSHRDTLGCSLLDLL